MKMLREEKWMFRCIGALSVKENHRVLRKAFREAVKTVREDAAKAAENTPYKLCDRCAKHLAAAIRRK